MFCVEFLSFKIEVYNIVHASYLAKLIFYYTYTQLL